MIVVAIDVGGTFTDLVAVNSESGEAKIEKVHSTPEDQSIGFLHGIDRILAGGIPDLIIHGTTIATNAVIERKGSKTGLITTQGFRDVLELRRRDRPHTYGLTGTFTPLVPRRWRKEVDERLAADGTELRPLAADDVRTAARELLKEGVESVAVVFMHSYTNDDHEQAAGRILREEWPNGHISLSAELIREFREFERTSTTVINAYVSPLLARYVRSIERRLADKGFGGRFLIVQSNGGVIGADMAPKRGAYTLLSGPSAGVIAGRSVGRAVGRSNVISADMGGTSLDVAVITEGQIHRREQLNVDYGIPVRGSVVDMEAVGAGGGSVARIDRAGLLCIGPESVGAQPGPVSYGRGGTVPCVTDANLVLGRINPSAAIGSEGKLTLDRDAAAAAITQRVGAPLGLDGVQAAEAICNVANHSMARSIRRLLVERGKDPRDYALVMFGGAGGLHAAEVARELGVREVVIPLYPGVTSALGCLLADIRHDFVRTFNQPLDSADLSEMARILRNHAAEGQQLLAEMTALFDRIEVEHRADLCFAGQTHTLQVPLAGDANDRDGIVRAFRQSYLEQFGSYLEGRSIQIVNLRTAVSGIRKSFSLEWGSGRAAPADAGAITQRPAYFSGKWHDTPIYQRGHMSIGMTLVGPAIIEQRDATTCVGPDVRVTVHPTGNLVMEVM